MWVVSHIKFLFRTELIVLTLQSPIGGNVMASVVNQ